MKTLLQLYPWQSGLVAALVYIAWPHVSTLWSYYNSTDLRAKLVIESAFIVAILIALIAVTAYTVYRDQQPKGRRAASQ